MLKVGSKGSAVKVLQSALRIVPADGEFGPQTRAKVVAYQKARKLSATGIVTSTVWRALSADANRPTGKYAAYDKVVLKVGSKGSAVKVLQSALRIVPADGEFGPQTRAKVVAYQKARKLSATGIVTSPVWRALSVDAARAASSVSRSTVRVRTAALAGRGRGEGEVRGLRQGGAQGRLQGMVGHGAADGPEDQAGRRRLRPADPGRRRALPEVPAAERHRRRHLRRLAGPERRRRAQAGAEAASRRPKPAPKPAPSPRRSRRPSPRPSRPRR